VCTFVKKIQRDRDTCLSRVNTRLFVPPLSLMPTDCSILDAGYLPKNTLNTCSSFFLLKSDISLCLLDVVELIFWKERREQSIGKTVRSLSY